jgi:hypothetical protein
MSINILVGLYFRERELAKSMGDKFLEYSEIVPGYVIPDFNILLSSSGELKKRK